MGFRMMIRGCIYFFYDKSGVVDDYVTYLLDDLVKNINELVIVSNGKINEDGHRKLSKYHCEVIERGNEGFDVGAYKAGIEYYGWEKVNSFDELIMMNHTIMGPVYPFSETFEKMDKRKDLDFWGITKHLKSGDPYKRNPYGYYPEHIQSHFIAVRKRMLNSSAYHTYWNKMPEIRTYMDSVCLHETFFTKHFADLGFKWDVSVDVEDLKAITAYPALYYGRELLENRRCPIFKRRAFFHDYGQFLETTAGQSAYEMYRYIKNHTSYNVDLIWQNALRTMNHADLAKNLHLNQTLSSTQVSLDWKNDFFARNRVVLFVHIYYTDEIPSLRKYIDNIPSEIDLLLTTQTEEKKTIIESAFRNWKGHVQVELVKNRGRDVSALLIAGKKYLRPYDIVCFIHDKKVTQEKPGSIGEGFAYNCYMNTLGSREYVYNILTDFDTHPRLGVICPPKPIHGPYIMGLVNDWGKNYENTKDLLNKLGVCAPIDRYKLPIAPHGSCFWFRKEALEKLFEYDWKYEDFPEEPLPIDGTISHAIERCYAFVAQDAGYYTVVGMIDSYAAIEYTTLLHYAGAFATRSLVGAGINRSAKQIDREMKIRAVLLKIMPPKIYEKTINFKRKLFGPYITYKYGDD